MPQTIKVFVSYSHQAVVWTRAGELGDRPRYILLCVAAGALLESIYRGLSPNSPGDWAFESGTY